MGQKGKTFYFIHSLSSHDRHSDSWMATRRLPSSMHRFHANLQFVTNYSHNWCSLYYSDAFSIIFELAKQHMHIYVHLFTHGSGHVNNLTVSTYVSLTCYLGFNVYLNNVFSFITKYGLCQKCFINNDFLSLEDALCCLLYFHFATL